MSKGDARSGQLNFFQHWLVRPQSPEPAAATSQAPVYELRQRPYQRSLRLSVLPNGRVIVTANKSASRKEINDFVDRQRLWIEKSLLKFHQLRERYPAKSFAPGEYFLFMGQNLCLRFVAGGGKKISFGIEDLQLLARIPLSRGLTEVGPNMSPELRAELKDELRAFFAQEAMTYLRGRLRHYAFLLDLKPKRLSFRAQKTRWGSCSADGGISLNWKLIVAPPRVIDYVVVHELAHLRHHNHSKAFWDLVREQLPDYRELRQWLKQNQYEADFLALRSELHPE